MTTHWIQMSRITFIILIKMTHFSWSFYSISTFISFRKSSLKYRFQVKSVGCRSQQCCDDLKKLLPLFELQFGPFCIMVLVNRNFWFRKNKISIINVYIQNWLFLMKAEISFLREKYIEWNRKWIVKTCHMSMLMSYWQ